MKKEYCLTKYDNYEDVKNVVDETETSDSFEINPSKADHSANTVTSKTIITDDLKSVVNEFVDRNTTAVTIKVTREYVEELKNA